jgi:hypothetical protein
VFGARTRVNVGDSTPSLPQALIHTSVELVHGAASARSLRSETLKPVFIKDRVASLIELIADAHLSTGQCVGTTAVPSHI